MEKKEMYQAPSAEVFEVAMEGCIAASANYGYSMTGLGDEESM